MIEDYFEFIPLFGGNLFPLAFIKLECFDEGDPLCEIHSFVDDVKLLKCSFFSGAFLRFGEMAE